MQDLGVIINTNDKLSSIQIFCLQKYCYLPILKTLAQAFSMV